MTGNSPSYELKKEEIYRNMAEGRTTQEMAKIFNVSTRTVRRWRKKFLKEEGLLSKEKRTELEQLFISTYIVALDRARGATVRDLYSEDPKTKRAAIYVLLALIKIQIELYTKLGIFPHESQKVEVTQNTQPVKADLSVILENIIKKKEAIKK